MARTKTDKRITVISLAVIAVLIAVIIGLLIGAKALKHANGDDVSPVGFVDGGFTNVSATVVEPNKTIPRVDVVFDMHCPGCGLIEREVMPALREKQDKGEIELWVYPVSFLDRASTDDYSSRAGSAFVQVASADPTKALDYLGALMDADFQPAEGPEYVPVSDGKLAEIAKSIGVKDDVADKIKDHKYQNWVRGNARKIAKNKVLFPGGNVSTPVVAVGGVPVDFSGATNVNQLVEAVLEKLEQ